LKAARSYLGKKKCFANTFCNCKNIKNKKGKKKKEKKKKKIMPERIHQLLALEKYGILYNLEPRNDI